MLAFSNQLALLVCQALLLGLDPAVISNNPTPKPEYDLNAGPPTEARIYFWIKRSWPSFCMVRGLCVLGYMPSSRLPWRVMLCPPPLMSLFSPVLTGLSLAGPKQFYWLYLTLKSNMLKDKANRCICKEIRPLLLHEGSHTGEEIQRDFTSKKERHNRKHISSY